MNREIIFRGKRVDNGEWVEGNLLVMGDDYWIVPNYKNASTRSTIEIIAQTIVRVEKETVGQYTGLKDSTGKRIFEGDIVHYKNSIEQAKGIIEWGGCQFYFKWIDITEPNGALYFFQCEKELEIIGNRFDKPELLEVQ